MRIDEPRHLDALDFTKSGGLVPVIAQHAHTGVVLMVAFADRVALERSLRDRRMWYYSRSRGAHWMKGETSGNTQHIVSLHADCDADSVLALVEPAGPACHTGEWSCFPARPALPALADVIEARARERPPGSHTTRLLDDENLRLKKLGEEGVELALACHSGNSTAVAAEAADLLYHMLVACRAAGVGLEDVLGVLAQRRGDGLLLPPDEQTVDRKEQDRAENRDQ